MVRSWIPAFLMPCSFQSLIPAFLMSFSCHSFPFKNLQLWTLDGKIVHSNLFPSIFLPSFLFKQLREWTLDGKISYSYFSHALFLSNTVFHSKTFNYELWMLDLGFLLFYTFLISFSFHGFLFKNLQDWTLNGKIVDFFFSHPIFLLLLLFKNLQFQLWMVRSWIPTFLMPFSF